MHHTLRRAARCTQLRDAHLLTHLLATHLPLRLLLRCSLPRRRRLPRRLPRRRLRLSLLGRLLPRARHRLLASGRLRPSTCGRLRLLHGGRLQLGRTWAHRGAGLGHTGWQPGHPGLQPQLRRAAARARFVTHPQRGGARPRSRAECVAATPPSAARRPRRAAGSCSTAGRRPRGARPARARPRPRRPRSSCR